MQSLTTVYIQILEICNFHGLMNFRVSAALFYGSLAFHSGCLLIIYHRMQSLWTVKQPQNLQTKNVTQKFVRIWYTSIIQYNSIKFDPVPKTLPLIIIEIFCVAECTLAY